jgi:hypothetical protein
MLKICNKKDDKIWDKFKQDDEGFYFNERMLIESEKRKNYIDSRRQNRLKNICRTYDEHMNNTRETYVSHMENENEDIKREGSGGRKKELKETRNLTYLPLSEKLSEIIRSKKNIKHTSQQIRGWTNDIRRMVEENGISYERIDNALKWYSEHIGNEYVPVIESGASLREKFLKLENAMNRHSVKTPYSDLPKEKIEYGIRWYLDEKTGNYYDSEGNKLK